MFSLSLFNKLNEEKKNEVASKLCSISTEEENEINDYLKYIQNSDANRQFFSSIIVDKEHKCYLSRDTIFRYYVNHSGFRAFLDDNALPHALHWITLLKEKEYMSFNIQSVDKAEEISIAKLMICAHLSTLMQDEKVQHSSEEKAFLVNKACELGSLKYLIQRIEINVDKLKESFEEIEIVGQFFNDIRRVGNLYGTFGYVKALEYLWELGLHLEGMSFDAKNPFAMAMFKMAADYQFRAMILFLDSNNILNQTIFTYATDGVGLQFFTADSKSIFYIPSTMFSQKSIDEVNKISYEKIKSMFLQKLSKSEYDEQNNNAINKIYTKETMNCPPFSEGANGVIARRRMV